MNKEALSLTYKIGDHVRISALNKILIGDIGAFENSALIMHNLVMDNGEVKSKVKIQYSIITNIEICNIVEAEEEKEAELPITVEEDQIMEDPIEQLTNDEWEEAKKERSQNREKQIGGSNGFFDNLTSSSDFYKHIKNKKGKE